MTPKRTALVSLGVLFVVLCSSMMSLQEVSKSVAVQAKHDREEGAKEEQARERARAALARIRKEAEAYAGREGHVIDEKNIARDASKSDDQQYERRIYLKLPLQDVDYHWVFSKKAQFMSGHLILTLRHGETVQSWTIFENGAISPEWEMMDCCVSNADETYFGFKAKKKCLISEMDRAELELTLSSDATGMGAYEQGFLKADTYRSFTSLCFTTWMSMRSMRF